MTHENIIIELAQRLNQTEEKVSETLDSVVAIIKEKLAENAQVSIPDFGVFETQKKAERISVNRQTRERFLVPPKVVVTFKPSEKMKEKFGKPI